MPTLLEVTIGVDDSVQISAIGQILELKCEDYINDDDS